MGGKLGNGPLPQAVTAGRQETGALGSVGLLHPAVRGRMGLSGSLESRRRRSALCQRGSMKKAFITGSTGQDGSYLAEKTAQLTGFSRQIQWDPSKPDGQPQRCLDVSRAKALFGFEARTSFDVGLRQTIDWHRLGAMSTLA